MRPRKDRNETPPHWKNEFTAAALAALPGLLDPDRCRDWLFQLLHPGPAGEVCPRCRGAFTERTARTFRQLKKLACPHCGNRFSALTVTALSGSHLKPAEIIFVAALAGMGIEARELAPLIGRNRSTAAANLLKIDALAEELEAKRNPAGQEKTPCRCGCACGAQPAGAVD